VHEGKDNARRDAYLCYLSFFIMLSECFSKTVLLPRPPIRIHMFL